MTKSRRIGDKGEQIACEYLLSKGYSIVDRNWSTTYGELDIIAKKAELYIFVEVKTHHSKNTESALASITPAKREKMIKAIYRYFYEHEIDSDDIVWRIDAIGIALPRNQSPIIDHVEDAFDW